MVEFIPGCLARLADSANLHRMELLGGARSRRIGARSRVVRRGSSVFKLFGNKDKGTRPFIVNDQGSYHFADLTKMPETQLTMLVPRQTWQRLAEYIANYESVSLAGRFGAEPGDYEWEWVSSPEALRWWRRAATGTESLFGMTVAVHRGEMVELYGLVEVDENSPHWAEVIPEEAANAMPGQARLTARTQGLPEQAVLFDLYRDYFRNRGMLTLEQPGQLALRRGTIREVERFRDALRSLLERASKVRLPSDTR